MHESEHVALMRRVSYIFQTRHLCSVAFAEWKVTAMTVSELLDVVNRKGN